MGMTVKELRDFVRDLALNDNSKVTIIVGKVGSDSYEVVKVTSGGLLVVEGIGISSDEHEIATLFGNIALLIDHTHASQRVYPTQAEEVGGDEGDGVVLTSAAGNWALGAIVEIIPANKISREFDVHEVIIEDVNTQDKTYELVLYQGVSDIELSRTRFAGSSTKGGIPNATMQTGLIPANSRVRGRLAIEDGGSKTIKISLRYHEY